MINSINLIRLIIIINSSFKKYDEFLKNKKIKITEEKYHKLFKKYFLKSSANNINKDLFNKNPNL